MTFFPGFFKFLFSCPPRSKTKTKTVSGWRRLRTLLTPASGTWWKLSRNYPLGPGKWEKWEVDLSNVYTIHLSSCHSTSLHLPWNIQKHGQLRSNAICSRSQKQRIKKIKKQNKNHDCKLDSKPCWFLKIHNRKCNYPPPSQPFIKSRRRESVRSHGGRRPMSESLFPHWSQPR